VEIHQEFRRPGLKTYAEVAANWRLWQERFDTGAEMTRAEFDALSIAAKVRMLTEAFGCEHEMVRL
jgi:hypothetical protein